MKISSDSNVEKEILWQPNSILCYTSAYVIYEWYLGSWFVFWMGTRMDNTIHVQVQIVEFNLIRIGFCDVRRLFNTIAFLRLNQNNK